MRGTGGAAKCAGLVAAGIVGVGFSLGSGYGNERTEVGLSQLRREQAVVTLQEGVKQ